MIITQTVNIPADSHNITLEVPREVPAGKTLISFTPAPDASPLHPCPLCAGYINPETGNPRYNAETVAAIEEGRAMLCGEIPATWYNSLDEMLEALEKDETDEE